MWFFSMQLDTKAMYHTNPKGRKRKIVVLLDSIGGRESTRVALGVEGHCVYCRNFVIDHSEKVSF